MELVGLSAHGSREEPDENPMGQNSKGKILLRPGFHVPGQAILGFPYF